MTAQEQVPLPGTRPEGAQDEREAAARVRDMFTRIAPRYDFLNHLLSFSMDHVWRRRTAKRLTHRVRRQPGEPAAFEPATPQRHPPLH